MVAPQCSTVCGSQGGGSGALGGSAAKITDLFVTQLVPAAGAIILLPVEEIQVGTALTADEANSQIVVNRDGVYQVEYAMSWSGAGVPSVEGGSALLINGAPPPNEFGAELFELQESLSYTFSTLLLLSAGDRIQLFANHNGAEPIGVLGRLWAFPVAFT